MKINQIVQETTTSGSVAPVEHGFVKMETRNPGVYGNTKAGSLFKGKKTKAPYANSINEGAMKQLSMDLKAGADGLSDQEFQKKYKMTKQEARKELTSNRKENNKPQPVSEAHLEEDDIILVPGQGRKMKTGFVPHGQSRVDHEVEMARSDLFSAAQNAQKVYSMIKDMSEEEGLEGWVQEKIIKANDYLNTIREYLEGKQVQGVAEGSENDISWMSPQQQQEYKSAKSAAQSHPEIWKQYQHYSIQDLKKEFPNQPDQELKYLLNVIQHGLDSYDPNHLLGQGRTIRTILQWKEQGQQGVAEDMNVFEDDQVRPQGRILKSLRDMAIASPTLTFQNFRQAGKESIITDAIMAAKVLKRYYQQKGNQTVAQFLYNLENELDDFRRGYNGSTDNLDLSDLSRGTLGKMQFQTNGGGGGSGGGGSGGGGAGKAIQSLKNLAVMKSALTMQQLTQAGREAIVSNAINAAKTLEQSYLQNKQQGNAIFVRALRDEIDNFMRGAPINASFPETDTASELGELLQGKLGKVNFQQGVAEGYQLDEGAIETITALVKKIPGIGKYYQMAQQYKPQLIEILKTSKSGKEVKQKMEQLAAGQSATVAESGMMKQLGGLAVGGGSILSTMWMNAMGLIDGVLAHAAAGEVGGAVASGSILGLIPVTLMLFAAMLMFKGSNQSSDEKAQAFQAQRRGQGVAEGTKVDRMVKHITKSEKKLGKSKDEAENIAWATANKRGMLDNKNKKAK